jgi:hypothetical protein
MFPGGVALMWTDFLIANILWAPAVVYGLFQFWNYMQWRRTVALPALIGRCFQCTPPASQVAERRFAEQRHTRHLLPRLPCSAD